MPPVALLTTGAPHMHYAHCYHPLYHGVNALLHMIASSAEDAVQICEMDGAFSNSRLLAFWQDEREKAWFTGSTPSNLCSLFPIRCQSHATHLVQMSLLTLCEVPLMSRLYSLGCFLRNLGYWLRLRVAVREWLESNLIFDTCGLPLDSERDRLMCELVNFIRYWKRAHTTGKKGLDMLDKK